MNRLNTHLPRSWRELALALALATAGIGAPAQQAASAPAGAASGPSARPEVAKALNAAQASTKAGDYKQALVHIAEAEAIPALTPYEAYIKERIKGPAAYGAGDVPLALKSFEIVLASPLLPGADRLVLIEACVRMSIQLRDYAGAGRWLKTYIAEGGTNAKLREAYPQVLSAAGDHAGAARELGAQVQADAAAGRTTPEPTLRLLASSQNALGDTAAYVATVERLALSTDKADYWVELIARATRRDGFAEERLRLDVYRLKLAAGVLTKDAELLDMAQRALLAGLPAEAQKLLDDGLAKGLLGSGADAASSQKLREQAAKAAAQDRATLAESENAARSGKDGNALFNLGFAVSGAGNHDKALALMTQGQTKGGLRRPDDAQLHLGVALWRANRPAEAKTAMAAVSGSDGSAELARVWTVLLSRPARQ